jgi:hypothetical protein
MNRIIAFMLLTFLMRSPCGFAADSFDPERFGGDLRDAPFSFVYDGRSSRDASDRFESRNSAVSQDRASKSRGSSSIIVPREGGGRLILDEGWNVTVKRKPGAAVLVYQKK